MRVPPGKMAGLLEKLRVLGTVTSENSTGEDITDEYVDLEARLKTMKASEARLLELLQRQTRKLADVLAVEKELTRVRGDIEAYEARRRNWDILTTLVFLPTVGAVLLAFISPAAKNTIRAIALLFSGATLGMLLLAAGAKWRP